MTGVLFLPVPRAIPSILKFIRGFVFLMTPGPCHWSNVNNPIIEPKLIKHRLIPCLRQLHRLRPLIPPFIRTQLCIHYAAVIWRGLPASLEEFVQQREKYVTSSDCIKTSLPRRYHPAFQNIRLKVRTAPL